MTERHGSGEQGAESRQIEPTPAARSARTAPGSRLPLVALVVAVVAAPAAAQVGYDPEHSPYRDVRRGSALFLGAGYFAGDAGNLGIGPSDGPVATARFELSLGGPTLVTIGTSYAMLERTVLDPSQAADSQRTGPFDTNVLMLEVGLQLRLTGQKSWRRMAPYLGAAMGLAFETSGPPDPANFNFGTKFTLAPGAGVRIYPGQHLSITADFRWLFWRLSYPTAYQLPSPDGSVILPPGASTTDWTAHPWTTVGVAWTF